MAEASGLTTIAQRENFGIPVAPPRAVTLRAVLLAVVILIPHVWWVVWATTGPELFWGIGAVGMAVPPTPLLLIIMLLGVNSVLGLLHSRWKLTRGELVAIFVIVSVSLAFGSMMGDVTNIVCHPIYFATQAGGQSYIPIARWIPDMLAPHDANVIRQLYEGGDFLNPTIWHAWLRPVVYWVAFTAVLGLVFLCMNALLYHRWAREERLDFPLTRLPLMLIQAETLGGLLRNRMLILGAGIVIVLQGATYMSRFYPSIPHLNLNVIELRQFVLTPPLSYLGRLRIAFLPYVVGLLFVLPVELLFSCWALFIIRKAEDLTSGLIGLQETVVDAGSFPWMREQATGAWIALFFIIVWGSRHHLIRLVREAFGKGGGGAAARDSGMSPRLAFAGLVLGFVALCAMSTAAGMATWFAVAFFVTYLIIIVTMTRVACQLGPGYNEIFPSNAGYALVSLAGSKNLPPASLTIMTTYYWALRSPRQEPFSHQMYGLRYAEATNQSQRSMVKVMLLAMLIAIPVGLICVLFNDYHMGLGSAKNVTWRVGAGNEAGAMLIGWLDTPHGPRADQLIAMAGSALFAVGLAAAQQRITGFPLHPLGWAIATVWTMEVFWSTFFTVWLVKALVLRYGGLRLYGCILPLFLGFALGDCLVAAITGIAATIARALGTPIT